MRGCSDQVSFDYSSTPLPPGTYDVEATTPTEAYACRVEYAENSWTAQCSGGEDNKLAWSPSSASVQGTPSRVTLVIRQGGKTLGSFTETPEYENYFPNGEHCGGACRVASFSVSLDVGSGGAGGAG